jgi:DNA polymerase-3 subunit epsilon
MREIVLDTETTGLSTKQGHRIIEIGAVELIDRELTGCHYHQYIQPEREIDAGAMAVHGIRPEFLSDKPVFAQVVDDFLSYVGSDTLVIHNAPFDCGFLDYELGLLDREERVSTRCTIIDTLVLARKKHVGQRNTLDALCKRYYIDNTKRELHGALLDAELLALVYLAMTGGQGSLFDQNLASAKRDQKQAGVVYVHDAKKASRIIAPSEEERHAHEALLSQMQQAGACLWQQEETVQSDELEEV